MVSFVMTWTRKTTYAPQSTGTALIAENSPITEKNKHKTVMYNRCITVNHIDLSEHSTHASSVGTSVFMHQM